MRHFNNKLCKFFNNKFQYFHLLLCFYSLSSCISLEEVRECVFKITTVANFLLAPEMEFTDNDIKLNFK